MSAAEPLTAVEIVGLERESEEWGVVFGIVAVRRLLSTIRARDEEIARLKAELVAERTWERDL